MAFELASPAGVVVVGTGPVDPADVVRVARGGAGVRLSDGGDGGESTATPRRGRRSWPTTTPPHYGISTGFGALATTPHPAERRAQLQRSLIRSHAAGSGPEVEREVVRALMLLRLSTLATGRTGVRPGDRAGVRRHARRRHHAGRPRVRLARLLRATSRRSPHVRAGADGRGRGPRRRRRAAGPPPTRSPTPGIAPVELAEKEGLALINGTDGMLGMLVLALPTCAGCCAPPTSPRR